ncbi:MAG TPA: pilus assembly protein PilM [Phycisphaerae bacterium]|nr:pilus assembly protein PilM [Phycisphaerae bacterium]
MFGVLNTGLCPIGIDVGTHSVRMLQFRRKGEALALQAACKVEMESGEGESGGRARLQGAIKRCLSLQPFIGRRAVMTLPPSAVASKSIRLPQMPDTDLQQALKWEVKDRFGFEMGEGQIVWFRAGEVRRGTEVKDELLLFAAKGQDLALHLDAAAGAGVTTAAIDLSACAGYRGAMRGGFQHPIGEAAAILDIGEHSSEFIITRNEQLTFYKHVEIGGHHLDTAVSQKLGISHIEAAQMRSRLATDGGGESAAPLVQALQDAIRPSLEELARELDMCMRYFVVTFRGSRPDLIALTGRQSSCPRILEALSNILGVPTEAAQPLRGVLDLQDVARPDRSGEWAVAAGLSLYPVEAAQQGAAA